MSCTAAREQTISTGAGNDLLAGGLDSDTYVVDSHGDIVYELVDEGIDTVIATVTHTLSENVENGTIAAGATNGLTLTGNELDNILTNASDWGQELSGGLGADKLYGGLSDDVLHGGEDSDVDMLAGGAGSDTYLAFDGDIIYDSDNRGWVSLGGQRISDGTWYKTATDGAQLYKSRDGTIEFAYYAEEKKLSVSSSNGTLTILNYRPVAPVLQRVGPPSLGLGITLSLGPDTPDTVRQELESAMASAEVVRPVRHDYTKSPPG